MSGFAELAAQYFYYRVLRMRCADVWMCNKEAFPVEVGYGFTNNDLGNNGFTPAYYGNKLCKSRLLSAMGGMDKAKIAASATALHVTGTKQSLTDDLYASAVTTNPSNMWYFNVGINAVGTVFTNGCIFSGYLELDVLFYEPKPVTS
jgi:hypothetical protein